MAKKILKITGYSLGGLLLLAILFLCYIVNFRPHVGVPKNLRVKATPRRIQHGRYLANYVSGCIDCHSQRNDTLYTEPLVEGTIGMGGAIFDLPDGHIVARNISSDQETGIGSWTDGELFRAITSGVSKDGSPLFPLMPYQNFGKMDKEDIYDIIAYLRTLPPIHHPVEKTKLHFPMNIIVHTIPQKGSFSKRPATTDSIKYGAYMVNSCCCGSCHSPKVKGADIPGQEFSGGFTIPLPSGGVVHSANITPDPETGIGTWTKEMFVMRFLSCRDSAYARPVTAKDPQTKMPWTFFGNMKRSDLEAIYDYLRTVKPVKNTVHPFADRQSH